MVSSQQIKSYRHDQLAVSYQRRGPIFQQMMTDGKWFWPLNTYDGSRAYGVSGK